MCSMCPILSPPVAAQVPAAEVLARIRSTAVASSPEIHALRAEVAAAQGRVAAAGAGEPALLSLETEEVPGGFGFDGPLPLRLAIEKSFLSGRRREAERAVAEAELAGLRARLAATERRVAAQADLSVVRTIGWAAVAARLRQEDSLLSSVEASLRTRLATTQARYVDVLRVRTERLGVAVSLSRATADSRAARVQLEAVLPPADSAAAVALADLDQLIESADEATLLQALPPPPSADSLLADAGAVRIAEADVGLAQAQSALLVALQRPQMSGYLGGERATGENGSAYFGPVMGFSVSLPFTARGSNRSAREAAQLEESAADEGLRTVRVRLRADLLAARTRYEAALEQANVFDPALLQAARAEREGALAAYRTGQLSLTELLDFERGLSSAESARIQSEISVAEALADLVTAAYSTASPSAP